MNTTATTEEIAEMVAKLHKFTVPFVGHSAYMAGESHTVTCSCGWSETVVGSENVLWGAAYRHAEKMRDDARMIQEERELEAIRSTPATTDPATTCNACGAEIAYSSTRYAHVHTANGSPVCATERFDVATPIPHCSHCGSVSAWTVTDTPWGIAHNCDPKTGCGHHFYYSLGD